MSYPVWSSLYICLSVVDFFFLYFDVPSLSVIWSLVVVSPTLTPRIYFEFDTSSFDAFRFVPHRFAAGILERIFWTFLKLHCCCFLLSLGHTSVQCVFSFSAFKRLKCCFWRLFNLCVGFYMLKNFFVRFHRPEMKPEVNNLQSRNL